MQKDKRRTKGHELQMPIQKTIRDFPAAHNKYLEPVWQLGSMEQQAKLVLKPVPNPEPQDVTVIGKDGKEIEVKGGKCKLAPEVTDAKVVLIYAKTTQGHIKGKDAYKAVGSAIACRDAYHAMLYRSSRPYLGKSMVRWGYKWIRVGRDTNPGKVLLAIGDRTKVPIHEITRVIGRDKTQTKSRSDPVARLRDIVNRQIKPALMEAECLLEIRVRNKHDMVEVRDPTSKQISRE